MIGLPYPKWGERPLLIVLRKRDSSLSKSDLLLHLEDKVPKWWLPDDVAFVEAMPHGATGKVLKTRLREQFRDWQPA